MLAHTRKKNKKFFFINEIYQKEHMINLKKTTMKYPNWSHVAFVLGFYN